MKDLTMVQREFLKILESFMHDRGYRMPEEFSEIQELYRMAGKHKMVAAVYEQIRLEDVLKKEEYSNLSVMWKRAAVRDVMFQIQRADGFLSIYKKLCDEGLKPLVVKGAICRKLYSKSDYRISGDEDMLLKKDEFTKCDELLLQEGFHREELDMNQLPYEIPYVHPKNGVYIELHFSLFPEESGAYGHLNEEFQEVFDHCIHEEVQGRSVWTLAPTEHFFYLICHSFKHFLHSGVGMRQVCDMVMMAEHYGNQIDWQVIGEKLSRLNMETYWNALAKLSVEQLGFSLEKAAYPKAMFEMNVDYYPMLADLLDSGIYGDSTMERKHSSNITLAAVQSGKKDTAASLRASLFPGAEYMKKQFLWLNKYPWLLPIAYLIRIVRYLKVSKKKEENEQSSVQIGMERVELLRRYNIIK